MLFAVDLKDKSPRDTCEVHNIRSDRHLPLELVAAKAVRAEPIPQPTFGVGHVTS